MVRDDDGFDTDDHGLDLIVHPDGRREWKDVEHLHVQRVQGRIDLDTVGAVLEAADGVVDLLDADDRWWAEYDDWVPEARAVDPRRAEASRRASAPIGPRRRVVPGCDGWDW